MSGVQPKRGGSPISAAKVKAARSKADSLTSDASLQYLRHHDVPTVINEILAAILAAQPTDPLVAIEHQLREVALRRAAANARANAAKPQAKTAGIHSSSPAREKVVATKTPKTTPSPTTPTPAASQATPVEPLQPPEAAATKTPQVVFVEVAEPAAAAAAESVEAPINDTERVTDAPPTTVAEAPSAGETLDANEVSASTELISADKTPQSEMANTTEAAALPEPALLPPDDGDASPIAPPDQQVPSEVTSDQVIEASMKEAEQEAAPEEAASTPQ
ncbi:Hypothetical protein, putative [Bodo saltans]|uniref:Uncharacterized protein n=1 Tax=Bodo saltans TaxID=75058 RepID=A0A0S4KMB5_BODSA|nr:Hypothetical protein, putative [Bodo saltans]|eukprot:CUI15561.1 Hypothetical protein, putative [Bodo saltans]